jgi:hypothetical protein
MENQTIENQPDRHILTLRLVPQDNHPVPETIQLVGGSKARCGKVVTDGVTVGIFGRQNEGITVIFCSDADKRLKPTRGSTWFDENGKSFPIDHPESPYEGVFRDLENPSEHLSPDKFYELYSPIE